MANKIGEPTVSSGSKTDVDRTADRDSAFKEAIDSQIELNRAVARHELALSKVAEALRQQESLQDF